MIYRRFCSTPGQTVPHPRRPSNLYSTSNSGRGVKIAAWHAAACTMFGTSRLGRCAAGDDRSAAARFQTVQEDQSPMSIERADVHSEAAGKNVESSGHDIEDSTRSGTCRLQIDGTGLEKSPAFRFGECFALGSASPSEAARHVVRNGLPDVSCTSMHASREGDDGDHFEYSDGLAAKRWSSKFCFEFLRSKERAWSAVDQFYSEMVKGHTSLSELVSNDVAGTAAVGRQIGTGNCVREVDSAAAGVTVKSQNGSKRNGGRWNRRTFRTVVAYNGSAFDGWQCQPGLHTVQDVIERALRKFAGETPRKKGAKAVVIPKEESSGGFVLVAGRTDKGVSACGQVCSFYSWDSCVQVSDIAKALDEAEPGNLRCISVEEVPRSFHPAFSATWRSYTYLLPLLPSEGGPCVPVQGITDPWPMTGKGRRQMRRDECEAFSDNAISPCGSDQIVREVDEVETAQGINRVAPVISSGGADHCAKGPQAVYKHIDSSDSVAHHVDSSDDMALDYNPPCKPVGVDVRAIDQALRRLEGKTLCYSLFARDTKPGRSSGPATQCILFRATASCVTLPVHDPLLECHTMQKELAEERGTSAKSSVPVLKVELVGNRFLRKMVRVLVSTAIREAAGGGQHNGLTDLMERYSDRRATAPPAPARGLCLVGVGYGKLES